MKKNRNQIVAAIITAAIMLSACGGGTLVSDPNDAGTKTSQTAAAAGETSASASGETTAAASGTGKTVAVALPKAWDSMMPLNTNNNYSRFVSDQIYDRLVMANADGSYSPRLAKEWTTNADSTAVTFKLADNVKWTDGEPLTADDVVFSFQMYSNPEISCLSRYYLEYIDGVDESGAQTSDKSINVKKTGDNEVTITMKSAMDLDTLLSDLNMVFIVPQHILEGKTAAEINAPDIWTDNPVGSGPFIYESQISGERMELKKNPDYFLGTPDIDKLIIRVVEPSSLLASLMSGDVDAIASGSIPLEDWDMAKQQDNLNAVSFQTTNYTMLIMNTQKSYLTEKVRQAISMAINRDVLVNSMLKGEGQAIVTPIAPISPYYNKDVKVWYDPDKAKQMLQEENFPFDQELKYYIPSGSSNERTASLIVQDLQKIGLKVSIVQLDFSVLMDKMRSGEHDLGMISSGGTLNPSESREMIAPGSSVNFCQNQDTELTDILDKGNAELTFEKRKPYFDKYQEMILEKSPMAYLYTKNNLLAFNKKLSGYNADNFSTMNWSIWEWKVSDQ